MVFHLVLCRLRPDVSAATVEDMMRQTRIQLLKIPEVKIIRCGQRIGEGNWDFFVTLEFESMEKLHLYSANPITHRYREEVLAPNVAQSSTHDFELEPGKDPRFS